MSTAAKRTLWVSVGLTCLTILGVHYGQVQESNNMYRGVLRDEERTKLREQAKLSGESLANTLVLQDPPSSPFSSSPSSSIPKQLDPDSILGFEPPVQANSKTIAEREREKRERKEDFERSQERLRRLVVEQGLSGEKQRGDAGV